MKTDKKIHYDVGQVDVEINHSHHNKLRILRMTMENWQHNEGAKLPLDSKGGRLFEADLHNVDELVDKGKVHGQEEFLTKEEMYEMNVIFKTYGGIRGAPKTSEELVLGRKPQFKFEDSLWDNVTFVTPDNS